MTNETDNNLLNPTKSPITLFQRLVREKKLSDANEVLKKFSQLFQMNLFKQLHDSYKILHLKRLNKFLTFTQYYACYGYELYLFRAAGNVLFYYSYKSENLFSDSKEKFSLPPELAKTLLLLYKNQRFVSKKGWKTLRISKAIAKLPWKFDCRKSDNDQYFLRQALKENEVDEFYDMKERTINGQFFLMENEKTHEDVSRTT